MSENTAPPGPTPVKEIVSHNMSYKAVVYDIGDDKTTSFEVAVYTWKEEDKKEMPIWERIGGPFVLDNIDAAERVAQENLSLLSGEMPDTNVEAALSQLIKDHSGDQNAAFLSPNNYDVSFVTPENSSQITPRKVAIVYDLYLVESDAKWLIGTLKEDGVIECWTVFESMEEALEQIGGEE